MDGRDLVLAEILKFVPVKNYLGVKIEKVKEVYEIKKFDYYFHEFISRIIGSYLIYDNIENLKNFLGEYKLIISSDKEIRINTALNFVDIITTLKKIPEDYKYLLREAYIGLFFMNKLKKYIPNIAYTYCYVESDKIVFENKNTIIFNNKSPDPNNLFPYLIKEMPEKSRTLYDFIKDTSVPSNIFEQYENVLNTMRRVLGQVKIVKLNFHKIYITEPEKILFFSDFQHSKLVQK